MAEYSFTPVEVPHIETKYRSIKTAIPVPESLPLFERLHKNEPRSMSGQPPIIWHSAEGFTVKDAYGNRWIDWSSGVLITNGTVDEAAAEEINKIFFEVIIAPNYDDKALAILEQKKNRIVLVQHCPNTSTMQFRSCLNGALGQERDLRVETVDDLKQVTKLPVAPAQVNDLLFANKIVKHSKSNAIVLAKGCQLYASGVGQTSRVDALKQAIAKAQSFGFDLNGAVMASDAFFPFADCVQIAHEAGINAVIQPGGSIRDNETIEYCDNNGVAMVITGIRHFKH